MKRKRIVVVLVVLVVLFLGLRTYLIMKPVDYTINHDPDWNEGKVMHILPTTNHERFLIKISFKDPLRKPPVLHVGSEKQVMGVMTDTEGRFWMFDAPGLLPQTTYNLALKDPAGQALCDSWPLETFPAPDSQPDHVRLLIYT